MSIFNQFPWVNYREYNLSWVISTVKDLQEIVDSALADVSNAVATYFADHLDTSLTQSGDAADAAVVGNRLTTLGNRVTTLENTAVHYYNFKKQGMDVIIIPHPLMTDRSTTDALLADIANNYQYVILFEGFPAENVCVDPNNSDNLLFNSTLYNVVFDTTEPKGSYTSRTESLGTVAVQFNVITPGYVKGDYATLDAKLTAGYTSNITANSSGLLNCSLIEAWQSGTTWILTIAGLSDTWQIECANDGTVTVITLP